MLSTPVNSYIHVQREEANKKLLNCKSLWTLEIRGIQCHKKLNCISETSIICSRSSPPSTKWYSEFSDTNIFLWDKYDFQKKQTPLHLAAIAGMQAACDTLINLGASVDSTDDFGQKPVRWWWWWWWWWWWAMHHDTGNQSGQSVSLSLFQVMNNNIDHFQGQIYPGHKSQNLECKELINIQTSLLI